MILYNATTKQGILQEIDRLCDTNDTSYTRQNKTARVNQAYEQVVGWLINADGTWQFDDSNYATLPIGLYNLTEGQTSYTFASDFLDIEEVNILTAGGQYKKIQPIDHRELIGARGASSGVLSRDFGGGLSIEEYFGITTGNTPKGMPTHYDKWEDSIKLYPAPAAASVTLASGLKIYFKRTAQLFTVASDTSTDTTEPGFASPWHIILAYMAAIPYCALYKPQRVAWLNKEFERMKAELINHYARRQKDVPSRMAVARHSNR